MRKVLSFVAAALIVGLTAGTASAGPLAFLSVEGSSDGGATFSNNLQVVAGTTYEYEVIFSMAGIGASNTQGSTTRTITSLTSADGSNALSFDVNNTASNAIPVTFSAVPSPPQQSTGGTLAPFWTGGSGQGPGTLIAGDTGIGTPGISTTAVRP